MRPLRRPRFGEWQQFVHRNWRFAVPALIAVLLTVPYIYGKTQSSNALARVTGYTPDYSWHRFTASNAHFVNELFYLVPNHVMTQGMLLLLWAAIFVYAFSRRDRMLELMAFWVVITPLPLAFIPLRGGACLYILLFGWAMIFAKLVSDLIRLLSESPISVSQGVGAGATTGTVIEGAATNRVRRGAITGVAAGKMWPQIFRIFATILVARLCSQYLPSGKINALALFPLLCSV
jgi:hypothetical protein